MGVPRALCGLAATALLAGCSTNSVHAGPTPAPAPPTTAAATAVTATPRPSAPGTQKWIDLQVGDCVTDLPPADLSRITVTMADCATPHLAEVYLRAPVAVDSAVAAVANQACAAGFTPYTGQSPTASTYSITWLIDSHQDRTGADPTPSIVICLLQAANGQLVSGSARR
ncbi:hypothetical protein [Mycobacterium angelicum]|uniref:Septum formation-related domain-containing protein n=1 Tax=Mycobacterium angelicum TaxID=470074 RepID=A0A1W9ZJP4_MYCAN|nr:hypothetical protein [Mycobacterium angelicum]MCV7195912.1 hypothetical protein [Mycobacterium angelicum]ORA16956.1 hypothetical protein BST12_20280 [Mycobacterium angelicum]